MQFYLGIIAKQIIMLKVILFGSLLLTFYAVGGIDKSDFLSRCEKDVCLKCENITFSQADSELFKTKEFNISNESCIIFEGGSFGIVNGDFFKQFPETKGISFKSSNLSLKASNVVENANIQYLEIRGCNVTENGHSNVLHNIPNLKTLDISENNLEHKLIDQGFLNTSINLETLALRDERSFYWNQGEPSKTVKLEFEQDILANLVNLETLQIEVRELTQIPPNFFENNQQMKFLEIKGPIESFPAGLPDSITTLRLEYSRFKKLSRKHLEGMQNLTCLWIRQSELTDVDVDAFEGTRKLEEVIFEHNKIKGLTAKHFANLHLKEFSSHALVD